jgi:hypothetical protein
MDKHATTLTSAAALFWLALAAAAWPNSPAAAGLLAVQAVGFVFARRDPVRHWPVLALALGQLLVIPFVLPVLAAVLASFWIFPLAAILRAAYRIDQDVESVIRVSTIGCLREGFEGHRTQHGQPLNALADGTPALLVFLRHAGCTFCRQTLADLARVREQLQDRGVVVVLVHQSSEEAMHVLLQRYGLSDLPVVHDPNRLLYKHFGLETGSWWQVANPWVVWKSAISAFAQRHGLSRPDGDPRQMSGVFAVAEHRVRAAYFHRQSSDRPDFVRIADRLNIS